jgi:hypothetical protein
MCTSRFKWAIWIAIGFVVAYTVTYFVVILTACIPIEAEWRMFDPTYHTTYHCASSDHLTVFSIVGGSFSVLTDAYCVLLPAMLVFRTRLTNKQKIGLIFIFGLGVLYVIWWTTGKYPVDSFAMHAD